MRNSRNGVARDCGRERFGIVAADVGGVAPRRQIRYLELHLEALLPLVAAFGRSLARGVGVIGEGDLARRGS